MKNNYKGYIPGYEKAMSDYNYRENLKEFFKSKTANVIGYNFDLDNTSKCYYVDSNNKVTLKLITTVPEEYYDATEEFREWLEQKNNPLTYDNLKEDTIYVGSWNDEGICNRCIFVKGKYGINIENKFLHYSFCAGSNIDFRLANERECKWLNLCVKHNKTICESQINLYDDITLELKTLTPVKNEFTRGDYIVHLGESHSGGRFFKQNYCFKQKENRSYLEVELDEEGDLNGWSVITFENTSTWRYATKEEIAEYNRLGKPYDVTTLNNPSFELNKWYKFNYDYNIRNFTIYGKCKTFTKDDFYFYDDSYIDTEKNWAEGNSINLKQTNLVYNQLTDLSEIQDYLPEGHPDKIVKPKSFNINDAQLTTKTQITKLSIEPVNSVDKELLTLTKLKLF